MRNNIYESIFSANALFIAGLLIMPAVVFNPNTEYRVVQFLFFWVLVWMSGKKTNFILTILITVSIIVFNLIIPYGRVLYSIGPFKITSGALTAGIHRAVTLQALVMLSRLSIRQDLKIPGVFGGILSESLIIFSVLMNRQKKLKGKNLFAKIDALMLEIDSGYYTADDIPQQKTSITGYVIILIVVFLSWLPWLVTIS